MFYVDLNSGTRQEIKLGELIFLFSKKCAGHLSYKVYLAKKTVYVQL